jgi:hypothetical protein
MKFIFAITIFLIISSSNAQEFYVSPKGSDSNPGTLKAPFKTFERSLKAVNKNAGGKVYFRGGYYYFNKTAVINKRDYLSPVIFSAYKNEQPVFTSGVHLTGWKKITASDPGYKFLPVNSRDEVFSAPLPEGIGMIRFLVDRNSDWLEQGRINVTGYVTTKKYIHGKSVEGQMWDPGNEKTVAEFSRSLEGLSNVDSALIFTIYTADFAMQVLPVKEINGSKLITTSPGAHRLALPEVGQRHGSTELAFIYNLLEGIDSPGKWACNPETKEIYLWPKSGTSEIYAPSLNELIKVEGVPEGDKAWFTTGPENPVKGVTFNGITFTNCKQPLWRSGDVFAQHGWVMIDKDNALLRFRGAERCLINNCRFIKSGGAGVAFDLYAKYNIVQNCRFDNLGYEAIRIAGYGIGKKDDSRYNIFRWNEISYTDEIHRYDAAVVLWNTGFNKIYDNFLHHIVNKAFLLSAPRSRAFTRNNQKLFPNDRQMREQAWPMARWFEIPDSALATIYYAEEEGDSIRRVEVDGVKQGDPDGGIADRRCSHFRYLRGNLIERNVIDSAAEGLFCDGIFYITGVASGKANTIRGNYIYDTGYYLPKDKIPFRLIYLDGYSGKLNFVDNIAFNDKFRFETMAFYNWWDNVTSFANVFFDVKAENYEGGVGNLFFGGGPNDPQKQFMGDYRAIIDALRHPPSPAPDPLPGAALIISELQSIIFNNGH